MFSPIYEDRGATLSLLTQIVLPLLHVIERQRPSDFAGLGIIFYWPPMGLPVLSLGDHDAFPFPVPAVGEEAIATVLAKISGRSSPWHDGFHLIDSSAVALTHPSQYVSPPLDVPPRLAASEVIGARQMTALLASNLTNVSCVALLNANGEVLVYQHGRRIQDLDLQK